MCRDEPEITYVGEPRIWGAGEPVFSPAVIDKAGDHVVSVTFKETCRYDIDANGCWGDISPLTLSVSLKAVNPLIKYTGDQLRELCQGETMDIEVIVAPKSMIRIGA